MSTHFLLKGKLSWFTLAITLVLVLSVSSLVLAADSQGVLEVHFIDVGQGDSILVITPDNKSLLIDAGDWRAGPTVISYLCSQGVNTIDVLVATHPHADHIGGLIAVLDAFQVKQVYDSGRIHTSQTFEEYLKTIDAKNIPFALARAGDKIILGDAVEITVLWPTGPRKSLDFRDLNESSVVLLLEYGEVGFLFTGDVGQQSEPEIIAQDFFRQAEVLKVGHHGSYSSSGREFLQALKPELGIISSGPENPYGHPHSEALERLTSAGVEVLRIDQLGSIEVHSDGTSFRVVDSERTLVQIEAPQVQHQELVNINTAPLQKLIELPGIGETLARRIIDYRIRKGLFINGEDLLKIKGIGEKTLAKIQSLITF